MIRTVVNVATSNAASKTAPLAPSGQGIRAKGQAPRGMFTLFIHPANGTAICARTPATAGNGTHVTATANPNNVKGATMGRDGPSFLDRVISGLFSG